VVAGIAVMLTVPVSLYEARRTDSNAELCSVGADSFQHSLASLCLQVANHLEHYAQPRLQRLVIRILWMVRAACLLADASR
jgi:hypothetical protein